MTPLDLSGTTTHTTVDYNEVHEVSVELLKMLQMSGSSVSVGASALALSLGRCLTPNPMSDDEEIKFVQDALEWTGMYLGSDGGVN